MIKEIDLKVPTSYSDIPLSKWLALQKEIKNYDGDENAITALMMYHLCGLDPKYLGGVAVEDYILIKAELEAFINNTDLPLQRIVNIKGVEYGFEPNLSQMSYGAYSDIVKFKELTINEDWASIMDILYRPIKQKKGDKYFIEPYTGDIDASKWLEVGMDVHFGALFFFVHLQMDLLKGILNSTILKDMNPNIKQILVKSGQLIPQSLSSPEEILQKLTRLPKNR